MKMFCMALMVSAVSLSLPVSSRLCRPVSEEGGLMIASTEAVHSCVDGWWVGVGLGTAG